MVGKTISHYKILQQLGVGGMGVVYEAEDLRLGRHVAIKFLPSDLAGDPQALERFQREARAASALNHPNICTIHDIDRDGDSHFIVMERMDGQTLHEKIRGNPLPTDELLDLAIQIATALAAAHVVGIVHRDLKPANIFINRDGQAKILDFGLAKLLPQFRACGDDGAETSLTVPGGAPGTMMYMSPEQALAKALDARTDLFSFGAVLYEMATGRPAFAAASSGAIVDAVLHHAPPPAGRTNPEIAPELDRIIAKALEKDRNLRYQNAVELRTDLKRLKRDADSGSRTQASPTAPAVSHKLPWQILAAIAVALLAGAGWLMFGRGRVPTVHAGQMSVAVLPFQNLGGDTSMDFLKVALPDQVLTTISYSPGLAVRPFSPSANTDVAGAGHDLRAETVVSGHFLRQGDTLQVTLEAVNVVSNRIVWRETVSGGMQDMISLQRQLAERVRQGLIAALGTTAGATEATRPTNAEAYDLFLRAAAFSLDPEPNRQALTLMQKAVALDPGFAPAWQSLSERYYHLGQDGGGGPAALELCKQAAQKAHNLDPNLITTLRGLVVLLTEGGDLNGAYDSAHELLMRRPENAEAHFAMSYVLRYAGLAEESAKECDAAVALDKNPLLRSCSIAYSESGKYERARQVTQQLVPGSSGWAWMDMADALRLKQNDDALAAAQRTEGDRGTLLADCVKRNLSSAGAEKLERLGSQFNDPETEFMYAAILTSCGHQAPALRLLRSAASHNFCGIATADHDPLLSPLRTNEEFRAIIASSQECRQRFLAHRGR